MAAKQRSKHQKELYTAYKNQNRFATNRKRKLLKLQKQQPNNEQITIAIANIKYRRKTPGTAMFSKTKIAQLTLAGKVKKSTIKFDKPFEKQMFKLGTRAHTNTGEVFSWSF